MGGAVFNLGGTVVVGNSTITGNTAQGGNAPGAGGGSGFGGGLFNLNGAVALTNVTVARNAVTAGTGSTAGSAAGGAVYNLSANVGTATATQTATVTAANDIFSDSVGGSDVENNQQTGTATLTATGPNIVSKAVVNTGGTVTNPGDLLVTNPNLGTLQNNGGPTATMLPALGSPAIDAGSTAALTAANFGGSVPATDQRGSGFPRVINGTVDIGASEGQLIPSTLNLSATSAVVNVGQLDKFTATVTAATGGAVAGTVTFFDGTTPLATVTLTNGVATYATQFLTTGVHAIQAAFTPAPGSLLLANTATLNITVVNPLPPLPPPPSALLVGGPTTGNALAYKASNGLYNLNTSLTFFAGLGVDVRTAVGDVNGDGKADYIGGTGPGQATRVVVIDGASLTVLASFRPFEAGFTGGVYVAAGDINGDGKADVVVTPDRGGGARVIVYDGASLKGGTQTPGVIASFLGLADLAGNTDASFRGGVRPALGDLTADGRVDLVIAAGYLGGPRVTVWDGAGVAAAGGNAPTTLPLLNFFAFEQSLRNGAFAAVGDVTGDGRGDLIFGGGPGGAPRVRVLDGALTLAAGGSADPDTQPALTVASFFAGASTLRGGVRVAAKEVNGDARNDLVTGSGEGEASRVRLYRGATIGANPTNPTPDQVIDPFGQLLANGVFVG